MSLRLVRLDCPRCGSALAGGNHDILFLCAHCGGGGILGATGLELAEATAILPASDRRASRWLPAWLLEGRVEVSGRLLAGGRPSPGSVTERSFIVPAFPLALTDLATLCRAYLRRAATLAEVPHEAVAGGTLARADAETFARHLVVGEEAARADKLAAVTVTFEVAAARLAALPFDLVNGRLTCSVTGIAVRS